MARQRNISSDEEAAQVARWLEQNAQADSAQQVEDVLVKAQRAHQGDDEAEWQREMGGGKENDKPSQDAVHLSPLAKEVREIAAARKAQQRKEQPQALGSKKESWIDKARNIFR